MNFKHWILLGLVVITSLMIGQGRTAPGMLNIAQYPLFARASLPPLNMLVMGKDHKIYYEAYNDASDLNGDGAPEVGYQGWRTKEVNGVTKFDIDYFGYFNSYACYTWDGAKFNPEGAAPNKTCTAQWSGDFLNYLTTSRMDALRRVLYGGWRQVDTTTETVLQGAFFPQDAHSWGKEYQSEARDGYNISNYAPLSTPKANTYHLFAVTTVTDNSAPLFRVMQDSPYRIWNWLSIQGPVAGNKCFNAGNSRVDCVSAASAAYPGHPNNRAEFDARETSHAIPANFLGNDGINRIDCNSAIGGATCNLQGAQDNYMTIITGVIRFRRAGTYQFKVDGDDAIDFQMFNGTTPLAGSQAGCYGNRGFSTCAANTATVVIAAAGNYNFKYRHEDVDGGDGYQLQWRKTAGDRQFAYTTMLIDAGGANNGPVLGNGGFNAQPTAAFYDLSPKLSATRRDDYSVRVSVCPTAATLQDSTCKAYPNGQYKPTGILHDYGETQRMYFGLITGSQQNNLEGGKLRRNVSNFASEIDANTGQFLTTVNGIARSIDRLRMIGGGYNGGVTNNGSTTNSDTNWNWGNNNGDCAGSANAVTNGNCRMWGNPIAEMMYESLRYFAGAGAPTTRFDTGGSANGSAEETLMGLTTESWKDPYAAVASGGLGYPTCAKPYQTVISDINPSYDGDLPGSAFASIDAENGFSASDQGAAIWNNEFNSQAQNVFIGQTDNLDDDAPTAKVASSFGNIRGLAPEEPTKEGTYYAASVARFGRVNDINTAADDQNLKTYSVALASPLPRIEVPVGAGKITMVPFAKTVSGTFGNGDRKPTNTIVDFYIQELKNFPGQVKDLNVNGGLPKAVFRINFEDVEQGSDHDMDAIVRYEVTATGTGQGATGVNVQVISEFAAGGANQYLGYVLSGSSSDGIYLEVCDLQNNVGNPNNSTDKSLCASPDTRYALNTPPGRNPGYCTNTTLADCAGLPPTSGVRSFVPGASSVTTLMDPLWYAAKYGGFNETSVEPTSMPDGTEWDADANGVPDNYFLVTNPLNLRSQLTKAFDAIEEQGGNSGSISISGSRIDQNSLAIIPSYKSLAGGHDWIGDLTAYNISASGALSTVKWSASSLLAVRTPTSRKIFTAVSNVNSGNQGTAVKDFQAANLGTTDTERFGKLGYNVAQITNLYGAVSPDDMVGYLRGERGKEGTVKPTSPFRKRTSVLGDIVNSAPVIATNRANYGWAASSGLTQAQRTDYTAYVANKSKPPARNEHAFVGANDGMLHAFDKDGNESFAYVPNGVLGSMGYLADPEYNHRYYVDGNLTLSDALVEGAWKTLLVGATGAGGRSVFALNVSNPTAFTKADVLWEINSQTPAYGGDLGYVMGKPVIVPTDSGRWVAIFGNGYNSPGDGTVNSPGYNPALFVVDVETGAVITTLKPEDNTDESNGLGNIAALDSDGDGMVDTVYGGDLQGNVWKFDIGGAEAAWSVALAGKPLFTATDAAGKPQPITGGFDIAVGPGTGYMLYFGTGSYFQEGDNSATVGQQLQSLYGIWDNNTALTTGRANLVGQAITPPAAETDPATRSVTRNPVSYLINRGWYLDLVVDDPATKDGAAGDGTGEKFIASPRIQSGKVFFPTYQPGFAEDCVPGGANWRYALDPLSGGAAYGKINLPEVGDGSTGAVQGEGGAPVRNVGIIQPQPPLPKYCDPADKACVLPPACDPKDPTCVPGGAAGCSEVFPDPIKPEKSTIIRRECGRQSWRQLL